MSIFAKITLATILVILLLVAGAAMVNLYRPTSPPLAEVTTSETTLAPTPPVPPAVDETNPFEASVVNPFEDEEYTNPFATETSTAEEEYVNPFANL